MASSSASRVRAPSRRTDDSQAFVETLGQLRPETPHYPKRVRQTAEAAKIEIAWLRFRSPELNPCEDLWRLLKGVIAASRANASLEEEAERAVAWLVGLTNEKRLHCCGLQSSQFLWLST